MTPDSDCTRWGSHKRHFGDRLPPPVPSATLVLSEDSAGTCMPPYEEVQTSASDLLDSQDSAGKPKCPQSRELPRIPPNGGTDTPVAARGADGDAGPGTEGPYEVLKDSCSQEHIVEDSLYETVTEIKEVAVAAAPGRVPSGRPKPAATKEPAVSGAPRGADFAEYASVDRNKKCRQSAPAPHVPGAPRDSEEEAPPPVPEKVLDENDNVPGRQGRPAAEEGAPDATSKVSPAVRPACTPLGAGGCGALGDTRLWDPCACAPQWGPGA